MKRSVSISALITFISLSWGACTSSVNGDDDNRTPGPIVVSKYIPLADPYILYHDGEYYAYGTSSDNGFEVYHSTELGYWKKHSDWLLHKGDSYAEKWFWAPEVFYNDSDRKFYLYYSADEHICVATGDSPLGPFSQEVKEPMRTEKSIDSTLYVDDDGTPYIFFVRFTDGNVIWGAELESDWMTIKEETLTKCIEVSEPWEMIQGKVAEGPSVLKKDGTYYMLYSANHYLNKDYALGYATSGSPLGVWEKSADNPIFRRPHPELAGTGHGAPFRDRDGAWKCVFHAHSSDEAVQPRKMYITAMSFSEGKIKIENNNIIFPQQIQ